MSCVLLKYVAIITLLSRLPSEIGCCSMTTSAIISLMHENPNYQYDPCYIQWKAAQDAELAQIWKRREELEKSIAENDRIRTENERIERENRQRSYASSSKVTVKKQSEIWKILGCIVGVIVGVCCCAACLTAACDNEDPTTNTTTNIPQNATADAQLVSVLASHTMGELSTFMNDNNDFNNLPVPPTSSLQDSRANAPLMPKRQNSLPSYDEAVKMPSAPLVE